MKKPEAQKRTQMKSSPGLILGERGEVRSESQISNQALLMSDRLEALECLLNASTQSWPTDTGGQDRASGLCRLNESAPEASRENPSNSK